jgi:hypothetical protein
MSVETYRYMQSKSIEYVEPRLYDNVSLIIQVCAYNMLMLEINIEKLTPKKLL